MSDTPTFDKWWNETGSNEYDVSDHAAVRAGWRACIAHRVVPLEYENAALRERIAELEKFISHPSTKILFELADVIDQTKKP